VKKVCIFTYILLIGVFNARAENAHPLNDFVQANEAYANGDYQKAIDLYLAVIQNGHPTGSLYFNIGNCHYRLDQIGWAILFYERAMRYIPDDPDLLFNLQHARNQVEDADEKKTMVPLKSTLNRLNLSELFWFMMICHIGFWGILIVRRFHRSEWSYYTFVVMSILWSISLVSFSIKWYDLNYDNRGIVVASTTVVRAGPDERETALFELHAGSIVGCERLEDDWRLIQFASGKRGWAKIDTIEPVRTENNI